MKGCNRKWQSGILFHFTVAPFCLLQRLFLRFTINLFSMGVFHVYLSLTKDQNPAKVMYDANLVLMPASHVKSSLNKS